MCRMTAALNFAALLCLLRVAVCEADPIVPATGTLHVSAGTLSFLHATDDPFAQGSLSGESFSFRFIAEEVSRGFGHAISSQIDPSFDTGGVLSGMLQVGDAVLDLSLGHFGWDIRIDAVPQPMPVSEPGAFFELSYPFQLTGSLFGSLHGTAYRYELFGAGTGSTLVIRSDHFVRPFATALSFEQQAPTPEPATILLFATGTAAVVRRLWLPNRDQ